MVSYKLAKKVHIAIIQRVDRKIDFRFRTLGAESRVGAAFVLVVLIVLAGHNENYLISR